MGSYQRLALHIINELLPTGNTSNLRLTVCKLMHTRGDSLSPLPERDKANGLRAHGDKATKVPTFDPCERVFLAIIRATISAFKIGSANNTLAFEHFLHALSCRLEPHDELILAREIANPTPPRGIAKIDIAQEASIAVFLLAAYILIRNGQQQLAFLRELAEALDIHSLLAERLIQTAKQAVSEQRLISQRLEQTRTPELMLA